MAPVKFGLFKARSRDYQEQPSTENLLNSSSSDLVGTPTSPIPSTSKGTTGDATSADVSGLNIDSEDDLSLSDTISQKNIVTRRISESGVDEVNYQLLEDQKSVDATSITTLNSDSEDHEKTLIDDGDGASTTCDVLSLQFDETSIAPSEDLSVYCGTLKKTKKNKTWKEKQLRDLDMWKASNVEVMQHLLSGSNTIDDQIKWEAIATARGLCTLKDSCTCDDCVRTKYITGGLADGDGGLGAAPLFSAISVGCSIQ